MKLRTIVACAVVALAHQVPAEERIEISLLRQPTLAESTVAPESPQATATESDRDHQAKSGHLDGKSELLQKKLREIEQLQREIDQLRSELGSQQQILVRVEMLEVSLTKLRKFGVETEVLSKVRLTTDDLESLKQATTMLGVGKSFTEEKAIVVKEVLEWLEHQGFAKVLTRPTIVTMSGRPACVFVGNELPAPASGDPESSVEYQRCGTELDVLAEALPNSSVRLHVRTRVSKPNDARSIIVGNTTIPSIQVRSFDTCVETEFGNSVVLNGLIDMRTDAVKNDSGNAREEDNEVALMMVVTPELVEAPVTAADQTGDKTRK